MNQKRTTAILAGILAVLVALFLIVLGVKSQKAKEAAEQKTAAETQGVITEQSAYSALTYSNGAATLSFSLGENGKWVWADQPDFPLNDAAVTKITELLASLKPQQTITEGDTLDAYGLDDPVMSLTATAAESGETTTLTFGNLTTDGKSGYMLMNGQESPVYIVANDLRTAMETPIYDMCVLPSFPALTEEQITAVSVTGAAVTQLRPIHSKAPEGEHASVVWMSGDTNVTKTTAVKALMEDLPSLTLDKCVDYLPSAAAAALCGFDAPVAVLSVDYATESGSEGGLKLTVGGQTPDGGSRYVRVNEDGSIYSMTAEHMDSIVILASGGIS